MSVYSIDVSNPTEPITSEFIKTHQRIDSVEEDENIDLFIRWARKSVEKDASITLVEKDVRMHFGEPQERYYLKYDTQESEVCKFSYIDLDGNTVELTNTELHTNELPNFVIATDVPVTARDIKIEYKATPSEDHPIILAVVERIIMMLSYNVKVKKAAAESYKYFIDTMGTKYFN